MPHNTKEKRRVYQRLAQRRIRNRIREKIKKIKAKTGCLKCTEKNPVCLVFHHRNPKKKLFAIQKAVSSKVPWAKVKKEIKKCDVLCMNCHAKFHHEEFLKRIVGE